MRKKRGKRTGSAFLICFLKKIKQEINKNSQTGEREKKTRFVEGVYFSIGNVKKECMEGR